MNRLFWGFFAMLFSKLRFELLMMPFKLKKVPFASLVPFAKLLEIVVLAIIR